MSQKQAQLGYELIGVRGIGRVSAEADMQINARLFRIPRDMLFSHNVFHTNTSNIEA